MQFSLQQLLRAMFAACVMLALWTYLPIDDIGSRAFVFATLAANLPRSAFRALLARIAALCNEFAPSSVSPYGGEGRFAVGASSLRVAFVNRPGEQRLSLSHAGPGLQVGAS
ncbi:MAG TPA: hypothetical protein VF278_18755 [Pirellulales bacterium]